MTGVDRRAGQVARSGPAPIPAAGESHLGCGNRQVGPSSSRFELHDPGLFLADGATDRRVHDAGSARDPSHEFPNGGEGTATPVTFPRFLGTDALASPR